MYSNAKSNVIKVIYDDFDFVHMQLKELLTQYPSVAGIWFDPITAYYENTEAFPVKETYSLIRKLSPHALISFKHGANGDVDFWRPSEKEILRFQS